MSKILRKALLAAPATLGAVLVISGEALANPASPSRSSSEVLQQINNYSTEGTAGRAQFTGASQFSDVSPSDWAFQALDDLVRRYDCLKGYPNGTYRGNRALTRYEFAAGLNACLQQIERLIAETTADFVTRDELETLRRLMQEFEVELTALGTRVDNLEGRVAFLEDHQFSTTTKLVGEVIFNLDTATGDRAKIFGFDGADYNDLSDLNGLAITPDLSEQDPASSFAQIIDRNGMLGLFESLGVIDSITMGELVNSADANFNANNLSAGDGGGADTLITNFISDLDTIQQDGNTNAADFNRNRNTAVAFGYRARLNFDTSFTGRDRLRTRLQARNLRNISLFGTGTAQTDPNKYGFTASDDVRLGKLHYRFPASDNVTLHVGATGMSIDDIIDSESTSPYAVDGLPLGLAYNNLFYEAPNADAAFGANIQFNESFGLDVGYFVDDANDANVGLFTGSYTIPVQLNLALNEDFKLALGYARSFSKGGTRTSGNVTLGGATSVLGASPFLYVNSSGNIIESATSANHWNVSGSFDLNENINLSAFVGYAQAIAESGVRTGDVADLWTWGANLGFPDLLKEDDVLVLGFGQLPYLVRAENGPNDRSAAYMANFEYRFPVSDNIEIAPGVYAVFNPNGNPNNDTTFVGMLRTTFSF
ncbi:MAG: iron uptake porin [Cyanobacteria bacterium P01_E01_bin.42]